MVELFIEIANYDTNIAAEISTIYKPCRSLRSWAP